MHPGECEGRGCSWSPRPPPYWLLLLQVPEEDSEAFAAAASALDGFTFSEIGGKAKQVFQMFM